MEIAGLRPGERLSEELYLMRTLLKPSAAQGLQKVYSEATFDLAMPASVNWKMCYSTGDDKSCSSRV